MLRRISDFSGDPGAGISVAAGQAPASGPLFPSGLEFNPPAHGTWNIVHIGMLVPEAHQIYICGVNCMRGVVLTAAEMDAAGRFSCVLLREEDITRGTVEQVTLAGIIDVLEKLPALPPCVLVFPVCTHHFLGVDMSFIYQKLEERFPGVDFVRAFMDPVFRKHLPPDRRLRKVMYDPLPDCAPEPRRVCLLGSDFSLDDTCDLRRLLAAGGYRWTDIQGCADYAAFKALSRAESFLCVHPAGHYGAGAAAKRLGRRYLYLPVSFDYDEISRQLRQLCDFFSLPCPDTAVEMARCDEALRLTREALGDTPVVIDATVHPRPLGLAALLLSRSIRVTEVYLDAVADDEEAAALAWLRTHAPTLRLLPMVRPEMRVLPRVREERTLAVGTRAAWFTGTPYFVNLVQGGGLWGFDGVRRMAALMLEALREEKDGRDLIPRKGLGCVSCI